MKKKFIQLFTYAAIMFSSFGMSGQGNEVPVPDFLPGMNQFELASIFEHNDGSIPKANIYYRKGLRPIGVEDEIYKPFVIVEGIDFGFDKSNLRNGEFGWKELWGENSEDFEMMVGGGLMMRLLYERGYDVIMVDFENGTDYIEKNALVVSTLLKKIENLKPFYPTKILGASMGGIVARLALTKLEALGESHCTTNYISLDSPHMGANIPLSFTSSFRVLVDYFPLLEDMYNGTINSRASRQLLVNHPEEDASIDRNNFQQFLNNSGLPKRSTNYAISNGSRSGVTQGFVPGNEIVDLDAACNMLSLKYYAAGHDRIVKFRIGNNDFELFAPDAKPLDHVPGGTRNTIEEYFKKISVKLGDEFDKPENFEPLHAFIPTTSALGIPSYHSNAVMTDIIGTPDNPILHSFPFDGYYAPTNNEMHAEVTHQNVGWIIDKLRIEDNISPRELALSDFNYYSKTSNKLRSVKLFDASTLYINGNIAGEDGSFPTQGSIFKAETCDCNTEIEVNNGGSVEIGASNGNKAELRITNNSVINLKAGSSLIVHPNSKLIFEAGSSAKLYGNIILKGNAKILFEEGSYVEIYSSSDFQFNSKNAVLAFEGKVRFMPNTIFQPTYINELGSIVFNTKTENVIFDYNTKFIIKGHSFEQSSLQILQEELVFPESLTKFHIERTKVELGMDTEVYVNSPAVLLLSNITSSLGRYGIFKLNNSFNVLETNFEKGNIALELENVITNTQEIENVHFKDNNLSLNVKVKNLSISTSTFENNLEGILFEKNYSRLSMSHVSFDNINNVAVTFLSTGGILNASNVTILNSEYGFHIERGRLNLLCSTLNNNNIALYGRDMSVLNLSTDYRAGKNEIIGNNCAIFIEEANFYLKNGRNKIYNKNCPTCYYVIKGTAKRYSNQSVNVSNNQWSSNLSSNYNKINVRSSYDNIKLNFFGNTSYFQGCNSISSKSLTNQENISNELFRFYPNPVKDKLFLLNHSYVSYEIYSIDGKLIRKGDIINDNINIKEAKGIYFIRFINENNEFVVEKISVL